MKYVIQVKLQDHRRAGRQPSGHALTGCSSETPLPFHGLLAQHVRLPLYDKDSDLTHPFRTTTSILTRFCVPSTPPVQGLRVNVRGRAVHLYSLDRYVASRNAARKLIDRT